MPNASPPPAPSAISLRTKNTPTPAPSRKPLRTASWKSKTFLKTPRKTTKVNVGSTVEITMSGKPFTYTIVGPVEANPLEGKISNESPIGKELLGRKVGDEFKFNGKTVVIKNML